MTSYKNIIGDAYDTCIGYCHGFLLKSLGLLGHILIDNYMNHISEIRIESRNIFLIGRAIKITTLHYLKSFKIL